MAANMIPGQFVQANNMQQQNMQQGMNSPKQSGWSQILAFLFGNQAGGEQLSTMTPEQQSILQFLMQQGQEGLQNPYEGFEGIEQQAQNQFNQQTVPGLAERFTSMGNNALSSPAFASQLGQAGAGLQGNLAALKSQYGMQNKQNALQQLQLGLKPQFENIYKTRQPGLLENLGTAAIKGATGG